MAELAERVDELRRLVKTDPDPRVCRRAQAVLMLAQGASVVGTVRWFRTAPCPPPRQARAVPGRRA